MREHVKSPDDITQTPKYQARKKRFLELFDPVHDRLEGFALAMTRTPEEAADLVGETVLLAFERFESIRDEQAFLSFLLTIASRVQKRRRWRGKIMAPFEEKHTARLQSRTTAPDVSADVTLLREALARLPEKQREAVVLHELSGFSLREVQEIQGGTLTAVKVRLHRARRKLARILGADDPASSGREATMALDEEETRDVPFLSYQSIPIK